MNRNRLREDRAGKRARVRAQERAVLTGVKITGDNGDKSWDIDQSMEELESLCKTTGLKVLEKIVQKRSAPDASYFVGEGKVREIKDIGNRVGADVVVFNKELSPAQSRNLEEETKLKIVDRNQLIMDIFAQRAQTKEAKLQVELAQLEYLLPRLRGWGEALERLGGGIGTRGPGETRLERDRQKILRRIESIKRKLEEASKEWEVKRKRRKKNGVPEVVLLGYTNTGKTTLLNRLTTSEGFTENKLFATLDPLSRRLELPDKREVVLIDTVGFIKDLPHQLIPAFRSTLKSAKYADLMINVLDGTRENLLSRWQTVNDILNEDIFDDPEERPPMINVVNKIDEIRNPGKIRRLHGQLEDFIEVSALKGENITELKDGIANQLGDKVEEVKVELPYSQADLLDWFHQHGSVINENYRDECIILEGEIEAHLLEELKRRIDGQGNVNQLT